MIHRLVLNASNCRLKRWSVFLSTFLPANMPHKNPIAYPRIQQMQAQQVPLMALLQHDPV
jgi:hypothetical protein